MARHLAPNSRAKAGNPLGQDTRISDFDRLDTYNKILTPPSVKFKDLEASINSTIRFNTLPMKVRVDYIPVTTTSIFSAVTLQFERKDLQYAQKDGVAKATIETAFELSPEDLADLTIALERRFKRKVEASVVVNRDLIGGARITVGDNVIDGTVQERLRAMTVQLRA